MKNSLNNYLVKILNQQGQDVAAVSIIKNEFNFISFTSLLDNYANHDNYEK